MKQKEGLLNTSPVKSNSIEKDWKQLSKIDLEVRFDLEMRND
jgi:hypothetical protein